MSQTELQRLEGRARATLEKLRRAVAEVRGLRDALDEAANKTKENAVREAQARFDKQSERARTEYEGALQLLKGRVKTFVGSSPSLTAPWSSQGQWSSWEPLEGATIPESVRIGAVRYPGSWSNLDLPVMLPLRNTKGFLVKGSGEHKAVARGVLEAVALRCLATTSPGKLQFAFFDPLGLGRSVAGFLPLSDYDQRLISGKVWTERRDIEQALRDVVEHMEGVIQKYLRKDFETLEDYNAQAGRLAEPYRLLLVYDFPAGFDDDSAQRLLTIAKNGPLTGVYPLVHYDPEIGTLHSFPVDEFLAALHVLAWPNPDLSIIPNTFSRKEHVFQFDEAPPEPLTTSVVHRVGALAREADQIKIGFDSICPDPDAWWTSDSRGGLRVPLGPSGVGRVQHLDLGRGTSQHVLLAGKTGSGKSSLLHTIVMNLSLNYSPSEVQLYLIDFKKGVEFKGYASGELPHATVVAVESEREFGQSVLKGLDAELTSRGEAFRRQGVDGLADFRDKTGAKMPRIFLLVDEFQEFFAEDDALAMEVRSILDRLMRQGRAFGIHVLLGSQTLRGAAAGLSPGTIEQMGVRIALQSSADDSRLVLADDNPAARLLTRPGEAIYNAANGRPEGNSPFQVAYLRDEERQPLIERVVSFARTRGFTRARPLIVFEGDEPAAIEQSPALRAVMERPASDRFPHVIDCWLGSPIAIKEPTFARLRPRPGNNLLIVGQDAQLATGLLTGTLVSLLAQLPRTTATVLLVDLAIADGAAGGALEALAGQFQRNVRLIGRREVADTLLGVHAEALRRMESERDDHGPVVVAISGLNRARDLRPDPDDFEGTSLAAKFTTVLREGPERGIFSVMWCDTVTNLRRSLTFDALREIDMRVALQMSVEGSDFLTDSTDANRLGPNRALLFNVEEGYREKFRPFRPPTVGWIEHAGHLLGGNEGLAGSKPAEHRSADLEWSPRDEGPQN